MRYCQKDSVPSAADDSGYHNFSIVPTKHQGILDNIGAQSLSLLPTPKRENNGPIHNGRGLCICRVNEQTPTNKRWDVASESVEGLWRTVSFDGNGPYLNIYITLPSRPTGPSTTRAAAKRASCSSIG